VILHTESPHQSEPLKLRFLITLFVALWLVSAFAVPYVAGDLEKSLVEQASAARVAALAAWIDREEQRVDTLRQWGIWAGDGNKYGNGIRAAEGRIKEYQQRLREQADS